LRDLFLFSALVLCWYWLRRPRRQRVGGWVDLPAYYKTPHWQRVRDKKRKAGKYRCEKCKSRERLEVHHIRYDTLHHEKLSDLQLLCHKCHTRGSGKK